MQRDISVIDLDDQQQLVIACDSIGGIGPKEEDSLQVPGEIVGKLGVRVALLEVLAVRAKPVTVINTLSVEYEPTGKEIIRGIKEEIAGLSIGPDKILNGSTEENVATTQTGVGITVIGVANKDNLKLANSKAGDILVAIGLPKVGGEVLTAANEIVSLKEMEQLLELNYIYDILPVGSKGIKYEAELLAEMNGLNLNLVNQAEIDLKKSAGPATVLLVTLPENRLDDLQQDISKSVNLLGNFYQIR